MREVDYDYELEKKLENGIFKYLELDNWFATYQYNYIFYAIQGCDKVINKDVLKFIITYAEMLLISPNENEKHDKDEIIFNCEYLLLQAIIVGCKHFEAYQYVILPLFRSESDIVRLWCHANFPLSICSVVDKDYERIAKIWEIRQQFYYCWDEGLFSNITKQRILYLAKALELKSINCFAFNNNVEFSAVTISSLLFENDIYVPIFDIDVLNIIQDKRILGYCINRLIEDEYLNFKGRVFLPTCLNISSSCKSTDKVKIKRPNAITTFDKIYKLKE